MNLEEAWSRVTGVYYQYHYRCLDCQISRTATIFDTWLTADFVRVEEGDSTPPIDHDSDGSPMNFYLIYPLGILGTIPPVMKIHSIKNPDDPYPPPPALIIDAILDTHMQQYHPGKTLRKISSN